ncbi:hypothetical protein [Actinocrispum sp. NPDC049592]|uniref:hypothetical protein n=1 Tax=Actinocrispum sp. NPDC049592 TaxID=3154835 RepID=UPI003442E6CE
MPDTKFRADLKNAFFRTTPMFSITNPVRPELEIPKRIAKRLEERPQKIFRPRLVLAIGMAFSVLLVGTVVAIQYSRTGAQQVADVTRVPPTAQPTAEQPADNNSGRATGGPSPVPQSAPTASEASPPPMPIAAPLGLSTLLPPGWTATTQTGAVTEARGPGEAILRLGGGQATGSDLLADRQAADAAAANRPGYTRILLAAQTFRSHPAVLWDFQDLRLDVSRRTRILYWQQNSTVYYVSLSAPSRTWDVTTDRLFDGFVNSATVS